MAAVLAFAPMLWLYAALLTVATIYCVYDPTTVGLDPQHGLYVLVVAIPIAIFLAWYGTRPDPSRWQGALARFARFEWDAPPNEEEPRTSAKKATGVKLEGTLKQLTALPVDLAHILERVGDGSPAAFFEIHPRIAYVAVVEATAMAGSDYTSVVMRLQELAPAFEARPLIPTDPPPAQIVGFTKDKEFSDRYVVEGAETKRVRAFLSEPLRAELCDMPSLWVHAEGRALAVTLYGDFDEQKARRLLEAADVFFAEYGADDGPSLLEPAGAKKKTTKKKKKKQPPPGDPVESPA